jgi:N6-adenosine-specific RNA methylase IME4
MSKNKKSFKGSGADLFLSPEPTTLSVEASTKELTINPVFQALIPPLSEEEYAQLEENLIENGIREAISIWDNTIVDGHNRYEIATKHNLPYSVISYEFDSEDDVKLWIFKNQIGRRNLPPFERVRLALHLKPVIAEKAKLQQIRKPVNSVVQNSAQQIESPNDFAQANFSEQIEHLENSVVQNSAQQNFTKTRDIIADMAGVSHDTVSKVEKILDAGTPETLEKIKRGDITVHKAYQDTRSQERRDEALTSDIKQPSLQLLDNNFSVIYADPPWESKFLADEDQEDTIGSYSMKFSDLKKLVIPVSDDAILLLWSSVSVLDKALQLMNAWGFKYRTNMIWDKQQIGLGQYVRGQHEMLLIGIRGSFTPPAEDARVGSVYSEESISQKTKPKWFYEQIEKMFPNETYLELFASNKYNDRWTVFGNIVTSMEVDLK